MKVIRQFFFAHIVLPLKCMATGRIKSKTGKGLAPKLCTSRSPSAKPKVVHCDQLQNAADRASTVVSFLCG